MLQDRNIRALWGLLRACQTLEGLGRKYADEKNAELMQMCMEQLEDSYKQSKFSLNF